MSPLQEKLFEMFSWLVDFMNEHNLRYYVVGGTMLGAVRHKGFIPWDDDIDIALPRPDYEKLIDLLSEPVDHYVLEAPRRSGSDYLYSYAKVYDMNTTLTEIKKKVITRGIFIDVFPLDGIGQTEEDAFNNYKKIDRNSVLLAMKANVAKKGRKWYKNLATYLAYLIPVGAKSLTAKLDKMCSARPYDEYEYVGHLTGVYRSKEILKREIYGTPTLYDFEGIKVCGPQKYDEYLTHLYKDWRKLPDEDKRRSEHPFVYLDLNKPWNEK